MSQETAQWRAWAVLFVRLVGGLTFLMAGVFKVFMLGPIGHAQNYFLPYQDTFLPLWSLWLTGVTIPFVELVGGGLLMIGCRVREVCLALGTVLVIVTFGHLLREPLFSLQDHIYPRLVMVMFVLVMGPAVDRFSVDAWLRQRHER